MGARNIIAFRSQQKQAYTVARVLDTDGIADALEELDFSDEEQEEERETLPTQPPVFRQLPRPAAGGSPFQSISAGNPSGVLQAEREAGASPRHLPAELFDLIVASLLDTHDFRSAALLNRSCRGIHEATLPRLWKVVIWRVEGKGEDFVGSIGWKELTRSQGFKYTRFLTLETNDPRSQFNKIASHSATSNIRAILITAPPSSYRPPPGHRNKGFDPDSNYHARRFTVTLTERYRYASADVFGLFQALGRGEHHTITMLPLPSPRTVGELDQGGVESVLSSDTIRSFFPAHSSNRQVHFEATWLDLSCLPDMDEGDDAGGEEEGVAEEWQHSLCAYAILEILRIEVYSTGAIRVGRFGLKGLDIGKSRICLQTYAMALAAVPSLSPSQGGLSLYLDVPTLPCAVALKVLSPLRKLFPAAMASRDITARDVAHLHSYGENGGRHATEWHCSFDKNRGTDGRLECARVGWPATDVYYKRFMMDICRYDEEGDIAECWKL